MLDRIGRVRHSSLTLAIGGCCCFAGVAPAQTDPLFVERAVEVGLVHESLTGFDDFGTNPQLVRDYVQSGIAFGDVNADGHVDLVACGSLASNRLFLGSESGSWSEVGTQSGIRSGELDRAPALGDYDRDGDLDLFIGSLDGAGFGPRPARGRLYDNDGTGFFEDVTGRSGTTGRGRTLFAIWYDLDLDGLLDLYTAEFHLTPNAWYRNNGDRSFTELAAEVGIDDPGSAHVVAIADANTDGFPDVFVGNDDGIAEVLGVKPHYGDALLLGSASGVFTDASVGSGIDIYRGIMGLAIGDVDYDGLPDVYKTDLGQNWMFVNRGWPETGVEWFDATYLLGVPNEFAPFLAPEVGWGKATGWSTFFIDADLDGWDDLFLVNGHVAGANATFSLIPRGQQNVLYRGLGSEAGFKFEIATEELGLADNVDDRAAAWADISGDGDPDIAVVPTAGSLRFFENQSELRGRRYLSFVIDAGTSAPEGIGAVIRMRANSGVRSARWIGADGPTASQNERRALFGLADETSADVTVELPSGIAIELADVAADQSIVVSEPALFELPRRVFPAFAFAQPGDPVSIRVVAIAHDSSGLALGPGRSVGIEIPGLSPIEDVVDLGDGRYSRRFGTNATPGAYRVEVDFEGFTPNIRPRVQLTGPVDAERSHVRVDFEALRAGSSDVVRMIVSPRDANGVALGSGQDVWMTPHAAGTPQPMFDLGDGRYVNLVSAPEVVGEFTPTVRVNDVELTSVPRLEAGGELDVARTKVLPVPTRRHEAASPNVIRAWVNLLDANDLRLGVGPSVELVPVPVPYETPIEPSAGGAGLQRPIPAGGGAGGAGAFLASEPNQGPTNPTPLAVVEVIEAVDRLPRQSCSHLFALRIPEVIFETQSSIEVDLFVDGKFVKRATLGLTF